jgi:hypothetical protein
MVETEEIKKLREQLAGVKKKPEKTYTLTESELTALMANAVKMANEPKKLTLEEAFDVIFSKDDIALFTNPKNFERLPSFIVSDTGKRLIVEMFGEFKKWLN